MQGDGFRFQAPATWIVVAQGQLGRRARAVPSTGSRCARFTLEKTYRPALFAAASRELDGVIAGIARQLSGRRSQAGRP